MCVDLVLSVHIGDPNLIPLSFSLVGGCNVYKLPGIPVSLDIFAFLCFVDGSFERIDA